MFSIIVRWEFPAASSIKLNMDGFDSVSGGGWNTWGLSWLSLVLFLGLLWKI